MISQTLQVRLEIWREKLALVESALDTELQKDFFSREMCYLHFLHREKLVCTSVISELLLLAEEATAAANK